MSNRIPTMTSMIFADPRWKPFRDADRSYDEAPAELLASSLEIALRELQTQAHLAGWLYGGLLAARAQLAEGRASSAAATLDGILAGPTSATKPAS